jgi:phenylalanyl-tRNA synthetase alpha chain
MDNRIKHLYSLPDLTRTPSPVKIVLDAILALPRFQKFDIIQIPEIVTVTENFDLLGIPMDHPARKVTDTYYLDHQHVLRTQTTTMWSYYLPNRNLQDPTSVLCYGKVYRNDEVDKTHYPCFHQLDGLYLTKQKITKQDLVDVLVDIAKAVYGPDIQWQVLDDHFPFTDPSIELGIRFGDTWLEVLGAGIVHPQVLKNFNINPQEYNGWAFGFGLDRLAMIKMGIPDIRILWSKDPRITQQFTSLSSVYTPVSNFPDTRRDVTFLIDKNFNHLTLFDLIRSLDNDTIEEVKLVDRFENDKKFGSRVSLSFRIIYRSHERTLTSDEVNATQSLIREKIVTDLKGELR